MVLLFRQLWQFQRESCAPPLRAALTRRAWRVCPQVSRPPILLLIILGFIGLSWWPNLALADENLALRKPVVAAGATWPGLAVESLTDGQPNTFTHPADGTDTTGYFFEVDLGREYLLERILIRNRNDGCCPERLTRYRIEVYADRGGETGALNWSTNVRADGSNSGVGGIDTVLASASPTQICQGRFIRVVHPGNEPYRPQLSEIEAYGTPGPSIRRLRVDDDTLSLGESTRLQWEISNATWANIEPGIGAVSATNGSVEIRPNATTTYILTAGNTAGSVSSTVLVGVDELLAPPQLTEFLAANASGLQDEDGDASDWIELHNPNRFSLDLGGFYLTDDPANRRRWAVPAHTLPPAGRLIVFASGKNRVGRAGELHTNFKLDAAGEYLALVAKNGTTILTQFPANHPTPARFPAQFTDVSYGLDAFGQPGFFRPATPGATNGPAFDGLVDPIQFSQERGFYDTPLQIALTTTTPGAQIRYTTDRTEPTATRGMIYSSPISVTGTTVLRAGAFRSGWAPAESVTHTYVLISNVITSSVMRRSITTNAIYGPQMRAALLDLPSISLVTPSTINGTTEVQASLEWLRPDGEPGFQEPCGVRLFGGAFTDFAKKSFRLYFRSEYGASKLKYPLFTGFERGLAAVDEFDQLELRSGSHDMSQRGFYLSNAFADDTLLEAGHLNPHGRFVHVYLNGTYWGMYHLRERWAAAMHARYLGGSRTNYESINGNWNVGGWPDPGIAYDGDGSIWTGVKAVRGQYSQVRPWVDLPEYIDFMVTWMFGGAEDEYRCVGPNVPGSGFKFFLNDADGWFCIPQYCAADNRTARSSPGRQPGDGPGSLFSMLLKEGHPEYRQLLADRIQRALGVDGVLSPARNIARLDARAAEISRAFLAESARWNYLTPTDWAARRNSARNTWLPRRTQEALTQFRSAGFLPAAQAPLFNPASGVVSNGVTLQFTGSTSGTIYFTTDGVDPRSPNGSPTPSARSFRLGGSRETLVSAGARWRWFTDAQGLGSGEVIVGHPNWSSANWKHPEFDDLKWSEGAAQLGYGEGDEATVLPFGNSANKWKVAYFRHRFSAQDAAGITTLTLRLKRDDGAVVYLNGREAARSAMPPGVITAETRAENPGDDGQDFHDLDIPTALLQSGTNLLAVELHQSSATTSDASFDLELLATRPGTSSGDLPTIHTNTRLLARTLEKGQWSGLVEGFYQTSPQAIALHQVLVSEFQAHPTLSEDSEFIELSNVSSQAVNLRGASFREGVDFSFPSHRDCTLAPGQRLLLVSDLFQFQRRYGIDIPVAGIFSGRLNNAGEPLSLVSASGETIFRFTYGSGSPWPAGADGGGYSLVLARPELGLSDPAAWRPSRLPGGNPGGDDRVRFMGTPGADGDMDGLPSLLEYALGTRDDDPASGPGAVQAAFGPGPQVRLSFQRVADAEDVNVWVEASPDLTEWHLAQRTSTRATETGMIEEIWETSGGEAPSLFMRLRVRQR